MGGMQQNVPRAPRVPDSLAGNYDAVKPITELRGKSTELTSKVKGTSASLQNREAPNMSQSVMGQPVTVSSVKFKKNVKNRSSSHGLV